MRASDILEREIALPSAEPMSPPGPSRPRAHFPPLDGLRGIAILLVVFHHSLHPEGHSALARVLRSLSGAGWCGVNLFFVLSGFLISGILLDARGTRQYFGNF